MHEFMNGFIPSHIPSSNNRNKTQKLWFFCPLEEIVIVITVVSCASIIKITPSGTAEVEMKMGFVPCI